VEVSYLNLDMYKFDHRKKVKAELSRLIPGKLTAHLDLLMASVRKFRISSDKSYSNLCYKQAGYQLGTPGGAKSFLSGAQMFQTLSNSFKLCPTHFSKGRRKFCSAPWLLAWLQTFISDLERIVIPKT